MRPAPWGRIPSRPGRRAAISMAASPSATAVSQLVADAGCNARDSPGASTGASRPTMPTPAVTRTAQVDGTRAASARSPSPTTAGVVTRAVWGALTLTEP